VPSGKTSRHLTPKTNPRPVLRASKGVKSPAQRTGNDAGNAFGPCRLQPSQPSQPSQMTDTCVADCVTVRPIRAYRVGPLDTAETRTFQCRASEVGVGQVGTL